MYKIDRRGGGWVQKSFTRNLPNFSLNWRMEVYIFVEITWLLNYVFLLGNPIHFKGSRPPQHLSATGCFLFTIIRNTVNVYTFQNTDCMHSAEHLSIVRTGTPDTISNLIGWTELSSAPIGRSLLAFSHWSKYWNINRLPGSVHK